MDDFHEQVSVDNIRQWIVTYLDKHRTLPCVPSEMTEREMEFYKQLIDAQTFIIFLRSKL